MCYRFLEIEPKAWAGMEETAASPDAAKHHIGAVRPFHPSHPIVLYVFTYFHSSWVRDWIRRSVPLGSIWGFWCSIRNTAYACRVQHRPHQIANKSPLLTAGPAASQ